MIINFKTNNNYFYMISKPILVTIVIWMLVEAIYFIVDKVREISERRRERNMKSTDINKK